MKALVSDPMGWIALTLLVTAVALASPATGFEISTSIGQVSPTACAQHRDGVRYAIRKINELNGGKGFKIGYAQADFVRFEDDTEIVDDTAFTGSAYDTEHQRVLQSLVDTKPSTLLVGTCSPKSGNENTIANTAQNMLLALVGPNAYYEDKLDYIFGMHISSYTEPSFKSAAFQGAKTVAIAGRKQSLFFQTTCAEGEKYALSYGMTMAMPRIEYEASGDTSLVKDEAYQKSVAEQICDSGADIYAGCVGFDEAKVWMKVWEEKGCKPKAIWLTCMTWGWKGGMGDIVADGQYMLGAGQWHEAMTYSDPVVGNSTDFIADFEPIYGFKPNYDAVAAYAAVYVYMKAIQKTFRDQDISSVANPGNLITDNYEKLRRTLSFLIERDTIYGPVEFDLEYKRNIGRQPAGMQFLGEYSANDSLDKMVDKCVAPSDVANSALIYPAPNAESCDAGEREVPNADLVNANATRCLLCNKCLACTNKYTASVGSCNFDGERSVTYAWSTEQPYRCDVSLALPGEKKIDCEYVPVDSGIALGVFVIDCFGAICTLICMGFIFVKSDNQIVKRSQPFFMLSFLAAALILNAASLPFLGPADDVSCALRPLLVSSGAALMLSALVVKMYRIKMILTMAEKLVCKAVTVGDMLPSFLAVYGIALGVWVAWMAVEAPEKTAYVKTIDEYNVTRQYECSTAGVFETLLIFYVGGVLLYACILVYQIRQMPDDLQETKPLLFSAYTIFLFSAFGIPLLFLIGDTMIRVILMSLFINIPVLVTVGCLCGPKMMKVMGYSLESETPSAIQTLQTTYKQTRNSKVTPSPTAPTQATTD